MGYRAKSLSVKGRYVEVEKQEEVEEVKEVVKEVEVEDEIGEMVDDTEEVDGEKEEWASLYDNGR